MARIEKNDTTAIDRPSTPEAATPAKSRFTVKPKDGGKLPTHQHVQLIDCVGYTDDAITAYALKSAGFSVIDRLTGQEYTGKKPN